MGRQKCSIQVTSANAFFSLILFLVTFLHCAFSAPYSFPKIKSPREKGCYYLLKHYQNGEQIETNEPCLNCSCVNSMLMCYLRVCPFIRPIGERCLIEKIPGECCPKITCPDVTPEPDPEPEPETHGPLTTEEPASGIGCYIDGKHFKEGQQINDGKQKACEVCYCIRNASVCVVQECALQVDGCTPVYTAGACCPSRYNCSAEAATTVPPELRHPLMPSEGCFANGRKYVDGEAVPSTDACEHCYCMKNEVVCAVQECKPPCEGCVPIPNDKEHCCPERYECAATTRSMPLSSANATNESISKDEVSDMFAETTPLSQVFKSAEGFSTKEKAAKEVMTDINQKPLNYSADFGNVYSNEFKNTGEGVPNLYNSDSLMSMNFSTTRGPIMSSTFTRIFSNDSVEPRKETGAFHLQYNATTFPENYTFSISTRRTTIRKPVFTSGVIPGEGVCRHSNKTYQNGDEVKSNNPCVEYCMCINSIVYCDEIVCEPDVVPQPGLKCEKVHFATECCPQFECYHTSIKETATEQTVTSGKPMETSTTINDTKITKSTLDETLSTTQTIDSKQPTMETTSQTTKNNDSTVTLTTYTTVETSTSSTIGEQTTKVTPTIKDKDATLLSSTTLDVQTSSSDTFTTTESVSSVFISSTNEENQKMATTAVTESLTNTETQTMTEVITEPARNSVSLTTERMMTSLKAVDSDVTTESESRKEVGEVTTEVKTTFSESPTRIQSSTSDISTATTNIPVTNTEHHNVKTEKGIESTRNDSVVSTQVFKEVTTTQEISTSDLMRNTTVIQTETDHPETSTYGASSIKGDSMTTKFEMNVTSVTENTVNKIELSTDSSSIVQKEESTESIIEEPTQSPKIISTTVVTESLVETTHASEKIDESTEKSNADDFTTRLSDSRNDAEKETKTVSETTQQEDSTQTNKIEVIEGDRSTVPSTVNDKRTTTTSIGILSSEDGEKTTSVPMGSKQATIETSQTSKIHDSTVTLATQSTVEISTISTIDEKITKTLPTLKDKASTLLSSTTSDVQKASSDTSTTTESVSSEFISSTNEGSQTMETAAITESAETQTMAEVVTVTRNSVPLTTERMMTSLKAVDSDVTTESESLNEVGEVTTEVKTSFSESPTKIQSSSSDISTTSKSIPDVTSIEHHKVTTEKEIESTSNDNELSTNVFRQVTKVQEISTGIEPEVTTSDLVRNTTVIQDYETDHPKTATYEISSLKDDFMTTKFEMNVTFVTDSTVNKIELSTDSLSIVQKAESTESIIEEPTQSPKIINTTVVTESLVETTHASEKIDESTEKSNADDFTTRLSDSRNDAEKETKTVSETTQQEESTQTNKIEVIEGDRSTVPSTVNDKRTTTTSIGILSSEDGDKTTSVHTKNENIETIMSVVSPVTEATRISSSTKLRDEFDSATTSSTKYEKEETTFVVTSDKAVSELDSTKIATKFVTTATEMPDKLEIGKSVKTTTLSDDKRIVEEVSTDTISTTSKFSSNKESTINDLRRMTTKVSETSKYEDKFKEFTTEKTEESSLNDNVVITQDSKRVTESVKELSTILTSVGTDSLIDSSSNKQRGTEASTVTQTIKESETSESRRSTVGSALSDSPRMTKVSQFEETVLDTEASIEVFENNSTEEPLKLPSSACVFNGKIYQSAEQIPRSHPCDFCFCFRGDIICLRQTCPPPIEQCFATPIEGFCCPRYECPVHVTTINVTSTTPFPFASHTATTTKEVKGCEVHNNFYKIGEVIKPASGPCMECRCDTSGLLQCNPKDCSRRPPLLLRMNKQFFA